MQTTTHPRPLSPGDHEDHGKPQQSPRTSQDGTGRQSRKAGQPTQTPIWVTATGSWKTRVTKARYYLRYKAWAPMRGQDGWEALFIVMCNLRRYHRLTDSFALTLVREHYNPRCLNSQGDPIPWTDAEILHKYSQAGKRGMYPTLGVADPKAKRKVWKIDLHKEVRGFLKKHTTPGGSCSPASLRQAFIAHRGGEDVKQKPFGQAVVAVTGIRATSSFGSRSYRGFQLKPKVTPMRAKRTLVKAA